MRKILLALVGWFVLGGTAAATPCLPDSLAGYIGLGAAGCTVGSSTFGDFASLPVPNAATPIDPATVTVSPVGAGSGVGFDFLLNSIAGAGQFFDILIGYDVSGPAVQSASVLLGSPAASGDGVVTAVTDLCAGGFFASGPGSCTGTSLPGLIAFVTATDAELSSQRMGPFTMPLGVVTDIGVDGGLTGSAALISAGNRFGLATPVPEPSSLAVAVLGFVLVMGFDQARRRRAMPFMV
jgi:hypothetical protein